MDTPAGGEAPQDRWYYRHHHGADPQGPYTLTQLVEAAHSRDIRSTTDVWQEGTPAWRRAGLRPQLQPTLHYPDESRAAAARRLVWIGVATLITGLGFIPGIAGEYMALREIRAVDAGERHPRTRQHAAATRRIAWGVVLTNIVILAVFWLAG